jgi:mannosyl-oligosaccharide alpha-1,2-mannosidase
LQLNDGCWNTYASDAYVFPSLRSANPHLAHFRTGIGPEAFAYISADGAYTGNGNPSAEQLAFYLEHGYYITAADYIQRPEVLESNFYAWRVTGDTKYLDRARSAVASFNKYLSTKTKTGSVTGFAGIYNVDNSTTTQIDETESFWFAEVLKYL